MGAHDSGQTKTEVDQKVHRVLGKFGRQVLEEEFPGLEEYAQQDRKSGSVLREQLPLVQYMENLQGGEEACQGV